MIESLFDPVPQCSLLVGASQQQSIAEPLIMATMLQGARVLSNIVEEVFLVGYLFKVTY